MVKASCLQSWEESIDMQKTRHSTLVLGQLCHDLIHIRSTSRLLRWRLDRRSGRLGLTTKHGGESRVLGLTKLWGLWLGKRGESGGVART